MLQHAVSQQVESTGPRKPSEAVPGLPGSVAAAIDTFRDDLVTFLASGGAVEEQELAGARRRALVPLAAAAAAAVAGHPAPDGASLTLTDPDGASVLRPPFADDQGGAGDAAVSDALAASLDAVKVWHRAAPRAVQEARQPSSGLARGVYLVAQTLHKLRLQLANAASQGAELADEAELVDATLSRLLHQRWLTEASLAATDAVYAALSCDGDNAEGARAALHQLSGGRVRTWWARPPPLGKTSAIERAVTVARLHGRHTL